METIMAGTFLRVVLFLSSNSLIQIPHTFVAVSNQVHSMEEGKDAKRDPNTHKHSHTSHVFP